MGLGAFLSRGGLEHSKLLHGRQEFNNLDWTFDIEVAQILNAIKCFWCMIFHQRHLSVVVAYSNHSHRWHCSKCNCTWDD